MVSNPKIIIADDHQLFREGLKLLIEMEGLGKVVAEAENGQALLELLEKHSPDLIIMDVEMPVMSGLETTRRAISINPNLIILVLTMYYGDEIFKSMRDAGVRGFILKTSGKKIIEKAIKTLINGEIFFSQKLQQ